MHPFFFMHKAPTFTSWGFVITLKSATKIVRSCWFLKIHLSVGLKTSLLRLTVAYPDSATQNPLTP